MRKVNVFSYELDEQFERGTIANRGAALGAKLGAQKIGAGLYEIDEGRWVWPYHYHHGVEEWLYVVAGAPVLRDRRGERTLTAGDFVCFPSGHVGAHTVAGPGRVVIFSVGGWPDPSVSVYPDSDKVGARPGETGVPRLDNLDFPREAAVGYWFGEGSGEPVDSPELVRAPTRGYRPLEFNVTTIPTDRIAVEPPDGFRVRTAPLGELLCAERLGATLYDIDPGQGSLRPYHYEYGREEWLLVIAGSPTLRSKAGEELLAAGDLVCFPEGPDGAHRVLNRSTEVARVVLFSTQEVPVVRIFPDSRRLMVSYSRDHDASLFRLEDELGSAEYWDGEA
jgi:uncharacterized cupin superfamily protein